MKNRLHLDLTSPAFEAGPQRLPALGAPSDP